MSSEAQEVDEEMPAPEPSELDRILDEVAPVEEIEETLAEAGDEPPAPDSLPGSQEEAEGVVASDAAPPEGDVADDAPPSAEDQRSVDVEDRAEAERKGLLAELKKWRLKAQEAEAVNRLQTQQAPAPAPQAPSEAEAPPAPGLPVQVSEDGQNVYVPQDAINQLVEQRVAQTVEQRMQPTAEQIQAHQIGLATQSFVAEHGEAGQRVVERAAQAEELLTHRLQNLMSQGYQVQTPQGAVDLLKQTGIADEVVGLFPEMAAVGVDEFVEGMGSGSATWRTSLLSRIAGAGAPPTPATPNGAEAAAQAATPPLRSVAGGPQSLGRKGGTRSQAPTADQAEFRELEGRFHAKPHELPQQDFNRLRELAAKLQMPGYE